MHELTTIRRSGEPGRLDLECEINRTGPPLSFPPEPLSAEPRPSHAPRVRRRVDRIPRSLGVVF